MPPGASSNYTPHHLIVVSAVSSSTGVLSAQQMKVRDAIKRDYQAINRSFDINDGDNGIWLPNDVDEARRIVLPLHAKSYGGLHNAEDGYTDVVKSAMFYVADRFDDHLTKDLNRITRSKVKNKETLRSKSEKSHGEVLYKIIERKVKPNLEKIVAGSEVFLN